MSFNVFNLSEAATNPFNFRFQLIKIPNFIYFRPHRSGLDTSDTLYSFCIPIKPSTSTSVTLASSFRTRCFFSSDKRSLSTNNVFITFSRSSPIFGFYVALTPSDHFRIDSKQSLAISQNYHSLLPFKRKERLQHSPSLIYTISRFFTFAGTPAAMQLSGISEQTTEPAAITLLLPILHPGRTITPAPIQTLSPIRISL